MNLLVSVIYKNFQILQAVLLHMVLHDNSDVMWTQKLQITQQPSMNDTVVLMKNLQK